MEHLVLGRFLTKKEKADRVENSTYKKKVWPAEWRFLCMKTRDEEFS